MWVYPSDLLLFTVLTATVSQISARCPRSRGQFPHETYCDKFYNCWDGSVEVQDCPTGLLFNDFPNKPYCDYPINVRCGLRKLSKPLVPFNSECPKPFGLFPDPFDCGQFLSCVNGIAYRRRCPPRTFFSQDSKVCNFDYLTPCRGQILARPPPLVSQEYPDAGSAIYPGDPGSSSSGSGGGSGSDGSSGPTGGSSGSSGGSPSGSGGPSDGAVTPTLAAPSGTGDYYPSLDDIYKPNSDGIYPSLTNTNYRCPTRNGYFPVSGDCSLVIVCLDYQSMLLTCPPGMLFDRRRSRCDYARYVQCF